MAENQAAPRQPRRKLVQITAATYGHSDEMTTVLYGLADDGTTWAYGDQRKWLLLPPIPTEET